MQRLGRKGHPVYRVVVQDRRQAPTSGKYVAMLGSYDPHTKTTTLNKEKAEFYLSNGAQPSPRVVHLLVTEKVKLPDWVEKPAKHKREIRNPEKLRRNRPAEAAAPEKPAEEPAPSEETPAVETEEPKVAEADNADTPAEDQTPTEEPVPAAEAVKEEPAAEKTDEPAETEKASEEKTA